MATAALEISDIREKQKGSIKLAVLKYVDENGAEQEFRTTITPNIQEMLDKKNYREFRLVKTGGEAITASMRIERA